jgi:hypothetical protein
LLIDVLGIPVWALGFVMAIKKSSGFLYKSVALSQMPGFIPLKRVGSNNER